jgi:3-keto-L-gulonate-6-phosphate decarboxylase
MKWIGGVSPRELPLIAKANFVIFIWTKSIKHASETSQKAPKKQITLA